MHCWIALGLPVVATDVGSIKEFVENDMGIIVKKNDPQELSEAFMKFFENQSQFDREEIIIKAQKYKWEKICQTIVFIYK